MGYQTLRGVERVGKNNHKNILKLYNKEVLQSKLESYVGSDIVVLTNPSFSRNGEVIKGNFRGGVLDKVEFYGTGNPNAHIWFKEGGFATGLGDVYDLMFSDWVKGNKLEKLKIFNFYGFVAGEIESSSVFDVDPFSAYVCLGQNRKGSSNKQILKSVELPKRGKVFR